MNLMKHPPIKSNKLRKSARGEECTFQIPGVCIGGGENLSTVLCHLRGPSGTGVMGGKEDDIFAGFGCSACHDRIDGRTKPLCDPEAQLFFEKRAMQRTWLRWVDSGLIKISGWM